jgi:hypothetical protein
MERQDRPTCTTILDFSVFTLTVSPRFPALPSTLMRSFRYFSCPTQTPRRALDAQYLLVPATNHTTQ